MMNYKRYFIDLVNKLLVGLVDLFFYDILVVVLVLSMYVLLELIIIVI